MSFDLHTDVLHASYKLLKKHLKNMLLTGVIKHTPYRLLKNFLPKSLQCSSKFLTVFLRIS
jgi:hypothetical protein